MTASPSRATLKIAAVITYVVMLVVNGLAGATTVLGGISTGDVSNNNPTLFAPAGLTFAVWGVIYLLTGLFVGRLLGVITPAAPRVDDPTLGRVVSLFVVSSVLNVIWLFLWQYELFLPSVIVMIGLFGTLLRIHTTLAPIPTSDTENLVTKVPFAVYYGWITIALVANIATWLVSIDWGRFGLAESTWTIITIAVVAAIALGQFASTRSIAYLLTIIWAVAGIAIKHVSDSGWDSQYEGVIITTAIVLGVLALALAARLVTAPVDAGGVFRLPGWLRWALAIVTVVAAIVGGAALWWQANERQPDETAEAILADPGPGVTVVDDGDRLTFEPVQVGPVGFILYPGAGVEPGAYAPEARDLAADGHLVVIPTMPLNLAVFDTNVATGIIDDHPAVEHWVIGGHRSAA